MSQQRLVFLAGMQDHKNQSSCAVDGPLTSLAQTGSSLCCASHSTLDLCACEPLTRIATRDDAYSNSVCPQVDQLQLRSSSSNRCQASDSNSRIEAERFRLFVTVLSCLSPPSKKRRATYTVAMDEKRKSTGARCRDKLTIECKLIECRLE